MYSYRHFTPGKKSISSRLVNGYTQADNPVMAPTDWRKLYYGNVDTTLLPGLAGAAAAAQLGIDYYRKQQPTDISNEMPDAVRQYMADPRYSDPFADTTR